MVSKVIQTIKHIVNVLQYGCIVSSSSDGTVKVWSQKGTEITTLHGHTQCANDAALLVKVSQSSIVDEGICLSVHLFFHLSVYPFACPAVCPSICLSSCLSIHLFVQLSVHPFVCVAVFLPPLLCLFKIFKMLPHL